MSKSMISLTWVRGKDTLMYLKSIPIICLPSKKHTRQIWNTALRIQNIPQKIENTLTSSVFPDVWRRNEGDQPHSGTTVGSYSKYGEQWLYFYKESKFGPNPRILSVVSTENDYSLYFLGYVDFMWCWMIW